jgi:hypothetical protein
MMKPKEEKSKFKNFIFSPDDSAFDLVYEDFIDIAKNFKYTSSVSQKHGNKIKFYKWNSSKPAAIDNVVLLSKSEHNKHIDLKNNEDLLKFYGKEVYDRISSILSTLDKKHKKK